MAGRFKDKVVLITGAASGLGRTVAIQVAAEGAELALVDISADGLAAVAAEVATVAPKSRVEQIVADVSKHDDVQRYVTETVGVYGRIDAFFNNAGIPGQQTLTEDFGVAEFDEVLAIDLRGVFLGLKYVLAVMRNQGFGSVVNTASAGGIRGVGVQSGYAAAKHGVVGLTRNSGVEYGEFGISVKAIAPGAIMTPLVEGQLREFGGADWEDLGRQFVSTNPMKRFGRPEEVAHLVAFLLSDQAAFINATVVSIDGGQSEKY